jgi:transcriptional regulator with XRE-family HTH domain
MRTRTIDTVALKLALVRKGWSQSQLADALDVPPTTLSSWLRGEHPSPPELQARLENALGISPGELDAADTKPATKTA